MRPRSAGIPSVPGGQVVQPAAALRDQLIGRRAIRARSVVEFEADPALFPSPLPLSGSFGKLPPGHLPSRPRQAGPVQGSAGPGWRSPNAADPPGRKQEVPQLAGDRRQPGTDPGFFGALGKPARPATT